MPMSPMYGAGQEVVLPVAALREAYGGALRITLRHWLINLACCLCAAHYLWLKALSIYEYGKALCLAGLL